MKEYSIDELKNRKFVYNKQPPKILNYFLVIVVLVIAFLIYLSIINVIEVDGILQENKKSVIVNSYPATVVEVKANEGSYVKKGDILVEMKNKDIDIEKDQLQNNIEYLKTRIQLYSELQENLKNKTNTFDQNNLNEQEFYYKVVQYFTECSEYEIDKSQLLSQGYSEEQANEQLRIYGIRKKYFFLDNYNKATNEKNSIQNQLLQIQTQLNQAENKELNIIANETGIVHFNPILNNGIYVEAGQEIASISRESEKRKFTVMIPAKDRSVINKGDDVEILIDGLDQQEYGTLSGKLNSIDIDSTVSDDGKIYFKGVVLLDDRTLFGSNNKKVKIPTGVTGRVRIKYKSMSYFKYFLDVLGIEI